MTIEQALQTAFGHHQAGRLAEAERGYRQVLAQCPDHVDALHLLGVLADQSGHTESAIALIGRAIDINPAVAEFHSNLGEAYRKAGQGDRAIASLRRAIEMKPDLAEAHNGLGNALKDKGRLDEAIGALRRGIELKPGYAESHNNLGNALKDQGRLDEAIAAYRRAMQLNPNLAEIHNNLGTALKDRGQLDEAIAAYRRAIALKPDHAEIQNNLGVALHETGRADEALAAYRLAIQLNPDHAEAQNNLGSALNAKGRLAEAVVALGHAIRLKPNMADPYSNLGVALLASGRPDEAITACNRAIQLQPELAEAHINLANALKAIGRLDEASDTYNRAIELKPGSPEAHNNLGNVFKEQGRLDEALACFRRAVERKPDYAVAASNLLVTLHYHPDHDAQTILAEHRRWAWQCAEPLAAQIRPHPNDRTPDRKLRIGFVSPDFRDHPVGRLLLPLFSHLDRRQTEIVGYGDVRVADGVTEQFKVLADQWHTIVGMSDPEVADRIRDDRIDILVDLALHTAGNRLLVFARKPAPVQVTMFGMPATTGLATIDYRLTDRYLDPPGASDGDYTEESIRLPHCFWCYQPPEEAPAIGELPARKNGFVTFGCLNQFAKVSRPALEVWVRILQSLPTSRLVIQSQPGRHLDAVRRRFQEGGIAVDRVEFAAKVPRDQYFHRYHELDLGLDPFPYNGHTSTLDSLWMGVPVITLVGRTAVGRGGLSLLSNLGLPELIAGTARQYVEIAVETAGDLDGLSELRARLRPRLSSSALMDGRQYAADVEAAFRRMWQTWCGQ